MTNMRCKDYIGKNTMKVLIITLVFSWLTACDTSRSDISFEVQKKGSKVEIEYRVILPKYYFFRLDFLHNKGDRQDRDRVKRLVGGFIKENGEWVQKPGVPFSLRLKIDKLEGAGSKQVFDENIFDSTKISIQENSFGKIIAVVPLKPGVYRFTIESLKDVPELNGTPVLFNFYINTKTFPTL